MGALLTCFAPMLRSVASADRSGRMGSSSKAAVNVGICGIPASGPKKARLTLPMSEGVDGCGGAGASAPSPRRCAQRAVVPGISGTPLSCSIWRRLTLRPFPICPTARSTSTTNAWMASNCGVRMSPRSPRPISSPLPMACPSLRNQPETGLDSSSCSMPDFMRRISSSTPSTHGIMVLSRTFLSALATGSLMPSQAVMMASAASLAFVSAVSACSCILSAMDCFSSSRASSSCCLRSWKFLPSAFSWSSSESRRCFAALVSRSCSSASQSSSALSRS